MDDWLGKLIHTIRLANDIVEKAEGIDYDAGHFLYDDHKRLEEAKGEFIKSLARELKILEIKELEL